VKWHLDAHSCVWDVVLRIDVDAPVFFSTVLLGDDLAHWCLLSLFFSLFWHSADWTANLGGNTLIYEVSTRSTQEKIYFPDHRDYNTPVTPLLPYLAGRK
jgi:hypothetical protein